jgi:hypothetical protein
LGGPFPFYQFGFCDPDVGQRSVFGIGAGSRNFVNHFQAHNHFSKNGVLLI